MPCSRWRIIQCEILSQISNLHQHFTTQPGAQQSQRQLPEKYIILEGTARYAGFLPAPAEGFGLWPRLFWPSAKTFFGLRQKPFNALWAINLWFTVKYTDIMVQGGQRVPSGPRYAMGTKWSRLCNGYLQWLPYGPKLAKGT